MATEYEYIRKYDSPNFTPAAKSQRVFGAPRKVTGITIHHWGITGQKFQNITNFLCRKDGNTSAHYVAEAGKVACIVDPDDVAWHAGNAKGNVSTIGIELRPEATDADYATAAALVRDLRKTYGDVPLYPHKHWKATACPGKWDLDRLDKLARKDAAPAPAKTYTVKAGDTLWAIATAKGTTVDALRKKNPTINAAGLIRPGDKIRL